MGAGSDKVYKGIDGYELNSQLAKSSIAKVNLAMGYLLSLAPQSGTYVNEADYFQQNWQNAFWGSNYSRLYAIKLKYDPNGLFYCHHCVGSELWTNDGMCKLNSLE